MSNHHKPKVCGGLVQYDVSKCRAMGWSVLANLYDVLSILCDKNKKRKQKSGEKKENTNKKTLSACQITTTKNCWWFGSIRCIKILSDCLASHGGQFQYDVSWKNVYTHMHVQHNIKFKNIKMKEKFILHFFNFFTSLQFTCT